MTRRTQPLPIDDVMPEIVSGLAERPNLVLRAETGAGKTTRVPPALVDALDEWEAEAKRVVMLEPRRVATRAAAKRIAHERRWSLGEEVGYQVRFDRRWSDESRLVVVTEGILVQWLQRDPFLDDVGVVIFDEFHERNLASDLSLAMARKVQREARDDLRMVVMSATLDPEPLREYLGAESTTVVDSPGRLYPVEVEYLSRPDPRSTPAVVRAGVEKMLDEVEGDVLVFLPGVGEIHRSKELLEPAARRRDLDLVPLYGNLPPEKQDAALRSGPRRRVVLATNVAETSVTVEGIEAVVDSGLARTMRSDPSYGLDRLELGRISRASAEQRKGRAGRLGPGRCLRLWTEHDDLSLQEEDVPEIRRVDLASTALELLAWGESDPQSFPWLDAPEPAAMNRALELLADLGATEDAAGQLGLTDVGRALARLPLHPRLGRLLLEGARRGVPGRTARLAAILSERDLVHRSGRGPAQASATTASDLLDRLQALEDLERRNYGETVLGPVDRGRGRHVLRVAKQLEDMARRRLGEDAGELREDSVLRSDDAVLRSLLAAYPDRVARRREKGSALGVMVGGRGVKLARMSSVREAEIFLAVELDAGKPGVHAESLVRQASLVERQWLEEDLRTEDAAYFDEESQRVRGARRTLYRDLVLEEVEIDPGQAQAEEVLAEAAAADPESALSLGSREVASFLDRVRSLREWMPELDLPAFDREDLARLMPHLVVGCRSFGDLRRAPLLEVLKGTLGYEELQALDRHAPERVRVPSGSRVRLDYEPGRPPVLAARIQELFGLGETPRVARGKVPVLMHLLAPNMRPQQVTQDLASFWENTYPEVRKELAGRYPKHHWPEDPHTAEARRRPGRGRR